ncbi:MAG: Ig-like domain-containing protein, partial [Alphaproteobacteria bacterium]|nr:Ig-like domain-containing protein [Alphaproteobacteria bacterium]
MITSTRSRTRFVWLLALAGCKGQDAAPELFPLADAQTAVGAELLIVLGATDPDGDPLTYAFRSDESVTAGATLEPDGAGARFTWTPTIDDLGPHEVTFTVQDGWLLDSATVEVLVVASEGSTAPVFVQPLGTGTTLDLGRGPCVEVPIVVTDPDTPGVTLGEAEPRIDGGELVQLDELTGTWTFCPTREQIGSGDRYALQLTADDFENPPTVKPYTIVVLGENGSSCPGDPPTVEHAPTDVRSLADVPITVRIRDDQGLKFEPLLYASSTDPGEPPDLTAMTQLTMSLASGTTQDGTWTALVPNPAARLSTGADAPLWYVVAATDNDDLEGSCDHTVLAPEGGSWSITVENPGGQGDGGICDPCTADAQCGGAGDLCVFFGDGPHCFADCELDTDCPADHYCSFSTFTSVDGERGRQCLPNDLVCDPPEPECQDDALEDNDTRATAVPLSEGLHHLTSCPASTGDDEDWYEVHLTGESTIEAILDGGPATDLDLA